MGVGAHWHARTPGARQTDPELEIVTGSNLGHKSFHFIVRGRSGPRVTPTIFQNKLGV